MCDCGRDDFVNFPIQYKFGRPFVFKIYAKPTLSIKKKMAGGPLTRPAMLSSLSVLDAGTPHQNFKIDLDSKLELVRLCDALLPSSGDSEELVDELLKFLWATRRKLIAAGKDPAKSPPSEVGMSPSTMIDDLWHQVLLNTYARDIVDACIGVVAHRVHVDEGCRSDIAKAYRQLCSMTYLYRLGFDVNVRLWETRDTVMASVKNVVVRDRLGKLSVVFFSDVWEPDEDSWISVLKAADIPEHSHFEWHNLALAYGTSPSLIDARSLIPPGPDTSIRRSGPNGCAEESIVINVKTLTGERVRISIPPTETVLALKAKLVANYYKGIPAWQLRLIFSRQQLEDHRMLDEYGISSGSTIDLLLRLRGC